MIKLFLVRHGEATEGWTSKDPPLSDLGKSQALSLAPFIDKIDLNKVDLVSSPLTRCKETANLALSKFKQEVEINDIFRELPSPIADLEKRVIWLRRVLPLTWPELLSDEETIASGVDLNECLVVGLGRDLIDVDLDAVVRAVATGFAGDTEGRDEIADRTRIVRFQ